MTNTTRNARTAIMKPDFADLFKSLAETAYRFDRNACEAHDGFRNANIRKAYTWRKQQLAKFRGQLWQNLCRNHITLEPLCTAASDC